MPAQPVTLDMSTAQPIQSAPVKLDMSTAQPIDSSQPPRGFLSNLWGDLKAIPSGIYHAVTDPDPISDPSVPEAEKNKLVEQSQNDAAAKIANRKQQGYGPVYSNVLAPAGEMMGVNVSGMEDSARRGDPAGVFGHAAAVPVVIGAGEIARRMGPPVVRGVAKGANVALERAPGAIGAAAGAAIGHATGIPEAGTMGSAIGYGVGKEVLPRLRVPGEDFGLPTPTYPGAPLPETPPAELLQARSLSAGAQPAVDPAAGLWTRTAKAELPEAFQPLPPKAPPVPGTADQPFVRPGQAGQLTASIQKPATSGEVAPGVNRGALQDLLDKSLGAKKLDPKLPLRQQMPATSGSSASTAPADAVPLPSSAEPEHMGQFARANGLELHQTIPETVEGDVLRAKIHDMSNTQVRQLAISSGVDMGQMPVTNAKNAGGVTRQQALKWIMMNRTPEEIGDMIDRGQHLPGPPSGAISSALASRNNGR
jgi:hypothetical protein